MKSFKSEYHITAPLSKVWGALVDPIIIDKWGAGPAKMSDKENSEFSIWGGDIYGTNRVSVREKKLEQDWFAGKWEKPSKVIMILTHKAGCTTVRLEHKDIPDSEYEGIKDGWDKYYFGEIKKLLEK